MRSFGRDEKRAEGQHTEPVGFAKVIESSRATPNGIASYKSDVRHHMLDYEADFHHLFSVDDRVVL